MNFFRCFALSIFLSAFSPVFAGELDDASEVSVVIEILYNYSPEAGGKKWRAKPCFWCLADEMQTILDEQLLAAIGPAGKAQNRLIACIGGDPLVDAQDVRLTDFRIDIPEIQGNTVTASVHFRNFGAPGVTKIKLHKIADGWVVTDIGNLRAELEQCAKP